MNVPFLALLFLLSYGSPSLLFAKVDIIGIERLGAHQLDGRGVYDQILSKTLLKNQLARLQVYPAARAKVNFKKCSNCCLSPANNDSNASGFDEGFQQTDSMNINRAYIFVNQGAAMIRSLDGLKNKAVGVERGVSYGKLIDNGQLTLRAVDRAEDLLQLLDKGRIDAFLAFAPDIYTVFRALDREPLPHQVNRPIAVVPQRLVCKGVSPGFIDQFNAMLGDLATEEGAKPLLGGVTSLDIDVDTLNFATHNGPPLSDFLRDVLQESVNPYGIQVTMKELPGRRVISLSNRGDVVGDASRVANFKQVSNDDTSNYRKVNEAIVLIRRVMVTRKDIHVDLPSWAEANLGRVAFLRGSKKIRNNIEEKNRNPVNNNLIALKMVSESRIRSAVIFKSVANLLIEQNPDLKDSLRIQDPPIEVSLMYTYLNKKHAQLIPVLEYALKRLKKDGRYHDIAERHWIAHIMEGGEFEPVN